MNENETKTDWKGQLYTSQPLADETIEDIYEYLGDLEPVINVHQNQDGTIPALTTIHLTHPKISRITAAINFLTYNMRVSINYFHFNNQPEEEDTDA